MMRKLYILPLALFLLLALALFWQLARNARGDDPTALESVRIGKPLPAFSLPALRAPEERVSSTTLAQRGPLLLNVWATWCPTCRAEHQFLNRLAGQGVRIVGLNYKDDRQQAIDWLRDLADPYAQNLFDGDGMAGLELGVYGAPETFLIDGQGIVRYRHIGALDAHVWQEKLQPLWLQAVGETTP